jgi:hypothetical protein
LRHSRQKEQQAESTMMIFFQTNPTAIFVFFISLILSSHHFSTALDSEAGMFSLSFLSLGDFLENG